ncbi:hypothetical protein BD309DRAFT_997870 [Dichomitus squalens]|uniref:Uncharacterized protein n=1 Tax=Dichomitus squalens TaxID=114155 RepID=A0A4Q9QAS9_9APHY|nr:hypothetical protein BD309DRAFT_997870 [Dichomitus squalens]TBU64370.1 hypothetical protein BD310DRAFT_914522 [Dichomitus squalens]
MDKAIGIAERVTQDAANIATASGVPGVGVVRSITNIQVIPTLRRVDDAVNKSRAELRRDVLPVQRKTKLQLGVDDIANTSIGMMESYNKGGFFAHVKLIPRASALEGRATDLYHEIKRSSDIHAAHLEGAFVDPALETRSLMEGWVGVHVADNEQYPPAPQPQPAPVAPEEQAFPPTRTPEAIPLRVLSTADHTVTHA